MNNNNCNFCHTHWRFAFNFAGSIISLFVNTFYLFRLDCITVLASIAQDSLKSAVCVKPLHCVINVGYCQRLYGPYCGWSVVSESRINYEMIKSLYNHEVLSYWAFQTSKRIRKAALCKFGGFRVKLDAKRQPP